MTARPPGFIDAFTPSMLYAGDASGRPTYQFAYGCPRTALLPLEELKDALDRSLSAPLGRRLLQYGNLNGHPGLLEALVHRLRAWGLRNAAPETLLITCGSTQALDMVCRALGRPGGEAVTEAPGYPGFLGAAEVQGLSLLEVPLDGDGLDPERLEHCLASARERTGAVPSFVYLIPDYQNPAGVLLHPGRRQALVEVAARAGTVLVEDLTYHELRYDGPEAPPLGSLDPTNVVSLGSFSKTVCPGVRLGWICARRDLVLRLRRYGSLLGLSALLQEAVFLLIREGTYDAMLARYRRSYREQRDAMVEALSRHLGPGSGARFTRPQGGFFVWLELDPSLDADSLASRCERSGVYALPSRLFHPAGRPCPPGLRLAFCFEAKDRIAHGVEILARVLRGEARGAGRAAAG
ncbi:MAG: PLP-dependent aminotransferase family protein [Acetobacteraceae bacterium]|nr:PLP-dependent aminotransferase family protein [Acetobacteraceae bacterium]